MIHLPPLKKNRCGAADSFVQRRYGRRPHGFEHLHRGRQVAPGGAGGNDGQWRSVWLTGKEDEKKEQHRSLLTPTI